MRSLITVLFIFSAYISVAQHAALEKAFEKFSTDSQCKNSIIGFTVMDAATGKAIFNSGGSLGLTPASALKVSTSIASYELLGSDHTFKTTIDLGRDANGNYYLKINGSGDPTFGSHKWSSTQYPLMLERFGKILIERGISEVKAVIVNDLNYTYQPLPNGWVWEDVGNYYGAGAWGFNWRENHYKVILKLGVVMGEPVTLHSTEPAFMKDRIVNQVTTGSDGSGDKTVIFAAPYSSKVFITGTMGAGVERASIMGAMPYPTEFFQKDLEEYFKNNKIRVATYTSAIELLQKGNSLTDIQFEQVDEIVSPNLQSIDYWFLQKSINAFGESLVKAIANKVGREATTANGVELIKAFWQLNGLEATSINFIDGSGLSPSNKITSEALVKMLYFAKDRKWYQQFYNNLPMMNGIRMKSGYIGGVRSYTGYIRSISGKEYIFAFIINNFNGNPSSIREKMWQVLNVLKV